MTDDTNLDANDLALTHGIAAVQAAFARRRMLDRDGAPDGAITAKPFVFRDPATIPRRRWVYGRHLLRGFVSLDIAAGGIGKSSVKVAEALALASGRPLLGKAVHGGPHRVWVYNLEDPIDETERRLHAAITYYGLDKDLLGDRLMVSSGRDQPLCLAETTRGGLQIVRPVADALIAEIVARGITVLSIDPFVSSHAVDENDNRAIDMVAKEWARIAGVCDCAVNLVHHVRKGNGAETTADSSRGASALIGAARSVIVYNRMTRDEATRAGIGPTEAASVFRLTNDKANLAPTEAADWLCIVGVPLPNGDTVGVAAPWHWPDPQAGLGPQQLQTIRQRIARGEWRADIRSGDAWVGVVIATAMEWDVLKDAARIKDILRQWLASGMIRVVERADRHRRPRKVVVPGDWPTE